MIPHLINNSLVMTNRHMFLFTNPARPNIYTLSLHDALPIYQLAPEEDVAEHQVVQADGDRLELGVVKEDEGIDRKSTRLNSSHGYSSYSGFCLKKKKVVMGNADFYRPLFLIIFAVLI